jgi:beta-glucosidase
LDDLSSIPADFVWGVATSAYQIEGAAAEDGRLPSIWDTFSHTPGRIPDNATGDIACDHYHRWREDIEIMKALGVDAYRFSVAWPRVVPGGDGPVNPAGLDFYERLVDALLEAGITPYPTLYHWDLPQALQDRGGWTVRETAEQFAVYTDIVAGALGDRVNSWVTLNEPSAPAWLGHLWGALPPGIADIGAAVPASYHLLLGHGLAAQAIRARVPGAQVGLAQLVIPCEPASDHEADIEATARFDGHLNRWWLDPLYGRGFPEDILRLYKTSLPVHEGDMETIATPLDWLGIVYYSPNVIADDPDSPLLRVRHVRTEDVRRTLLGWEVRAEGLERVLVRMTRDYGVRKLYVAENGSAWPDTVTKDGQVHDPDRVRYLEEHLVACSRAIELGVPLAGYFAWSLLDCFEWVFGYETRFGLCYVDFETQRRLIKDSGARYASIIRSHRGREAARARVTT